MALIAWPTNPTVGQVYNFGNVTYTWTGTTWTPGTGQVSATGPTGATGGAGGAGVTGPTGSGSATVLYPGYFI